MTLQNFIEKLPTDINGSQGLYGKELNYVKEFLNSLEQFKDKNINIIEKLEITDSVMENTENGLIFKSKTTPEVVTIKYDENLQFKDNINIYAIFKQGDDIFLRLTKNSF